MDLPHYDLDSLVYLSTDIVLADLSQDAQGNFTATVTESLYGALQPGEKLEGLTPFLTFYQPLTNGQKVVLFLDRRPHEYDFFHRNAAKSPFAVPPSGVYLIDEYGHIHEYFQPNNPGPYVAQGYSFFIEHATPTEKEDLALPTLDEIKARIAVSIKITTPIRDFLDQSATAENVPALTKLLIARPRYPETCTVERYDAVAADIVQKIRSLNDPELALSLSHLAPEVVTFPVVDASGSVDQSATTSRVRLLIRILGDRNRDAPMRAASVPILLSLSRFHNDPIGNGWSASFSDQIVATAKTVLNDSKEDSGLRALSLQFLDLNNPANVADVRRVYTHTRSPELQFAIEQAFIEVSDELYQTLHTASGPVASIIQLAPEHGCVQPPENQITFLIRFYATKAYNERGSVVITSRMVLKNTKSGQVFVVASARGMGGHYGTVQGVLPFSLDQLSDFSAGVYTLGMEYAHQFGHFPNAGELQEAPSAGHTITIAISDSAKGKVLSIPLLGTIRWHQPAAHKASEPASVQSKPTPAGPPPASHNSSVKSVVYTVTGLTFPGAGPQHTETFQFTASNFITSAIDLSASRLDSCVNCIKSGTAVQFFPNGTLNLIVPADSVHFTDDDRIVYGWVFPPGAFTASGTYKAFDYPPYIVSDVATMTVRAISAAPETTRKVRSAKCLYLWDCATRPTLSSPAVLPR